MAKKNATAIAAILSTTFGPLIAEVNKKNEILRSAGVEDARGDKTLSTMVGLMCQMVWRSTFGNVVLANGSSMPSAQQRVNDAKAYIDQMPKTKDGAPQISTEEDAKVLLWVDTNNARLQCNTDLLDGLKEFYHKITGEHWVPRADERQARGTIPFNDVMRSKLTEAFTKQQQASAS